MDACHQIFFINGNESIEAVCAYCTQVCFHISAETLNSDIYVVMIIHKVSLFKHLFYTGKQQILIPVL
jgi:hypothetical protein